MNSPLDQLQRSQALNPAQSFIVQAPAGSGKTELLVQRFLVLLSHAKQPEEIIAITFTRKAANEMRSRIIDALIAAANPDSINKFTSQTLQLARQALAQNRRLHWDIIHNPNRLRVFTIDALCTSLTRQMPVLSQFGAALTINEKPQSLYQQAVHNLLHTLETQEPWSRALQRLLSHLDNDFAKAEKLLLSMLARRDQWLPYFTTMRNATELRHQLEQSLANSVLENLQRCVSSLPPELANELADLASFAASQLKLSGATSPILACLNLPNLPGTALQHQAQWIGIAHLLLTGDKTWRLQITVKNGFPKEAEYQPQKKRMLALLNKLSVCSAFRQSLEDIINSPPPHYTDQQWQIIAALGQVLPILAAQLTLVFKETGSVDFIEVATAARRALGDLDSPTDLALSLDYQIRHLLVDEFQDTAISQFHLLEMLTAGWQENDGRSLFLVGDPMQSIYRFRQAEVGLFFRAREDGIGQIRLIPLTLQVNFRSTPGVVNWLNTSFKTIFPQTDNITAGAVPFSPSVAYKAAAATSAVHFHAFVNAKEKLLGEKILAEKIVAIITAAKLDNPEQTIAILVRSRSHLAPIIAALQQAQIKYQGVELEKLQEQPVIRDLFALTKALFQLADRLSWFAILRAPWCGLTLADLQALAQANPQGVLWETLLIADTLATLSNDGKLRLQRLMQVLAPTINQRQRQSAALWIENTWRALAGPACVKNVVELSYAQVYFKLLEATPLSAAAEDFVQLETKLAQMYAPLDETADSSLQIMTIHKAKGLEFDTVILPCLERVSGKDEESLLLWMKRPMPHGTDDLLLAPIKPNTEKEDAIYHYLKLQEAQKTYHEGARLLYVAATRAKSQLHLLANPQPDKNAAIKPKKDSFLQYLWPLVAEEFTNIPITASVANQMQSLPPQWLTRLTTVWQSPLPAHKTVVQQKKIPGQNNVRLLPIAPRAVGTVIHRCLQMIATVGLQQWQSGNIEQRQLLWQKNLVELGVAQIELPECITVIADAVEKTLKDPRGQWLLAKHFQAQSEYGLTLLLDNNQPQQFFIDRTFIDNGTRWIIDYKTTVPENLPMEDFIQQQKNNYQSQLAIYARAMRNLEELPIRVGLYFPLVAGWCEWEFEELSAVGV